MSETREQAREQLLTAINTTLAARNIKLLGKLGDHTRGEIEITGEPTIYDYNARFFVDLHFPVVFPGGKAGAFTIRSNANSAVSDGAVFAVILNQKIAIVKQWRLPLSRWTYEVPRGFGEKLDNAKVNGNLGTMQIADLPLVGLFRELGEEVAQNTTVQSVSFLGNIAENTGTCMGTPSFYLINLSTPPEKLDECIRSRREDEIKVELWTLAKCNEELGQKLSDTFSIAALALVRKHIEALDLQ